MDNQEASRSASQSSKVSRPKSKDRKKETEKKKKSSANKRIHSTASTSSDAPDYIIPLVLTSKTQEIFGCRINEEITQENPFKLIKKSEILNDLKARAAVSDFHPFKKIVTGYPGDELLIVLDVDFKYGQNFYLVATEDAKERILQPPESVLDQETDEDLFEYTYKLPVSKPWISLGSEIEVAEGMVNDTQSKLKVLISRVYKEFGSTTEFGDRNSSSVKDGYVECPSLPDKRSTIKLKERDIGLQVVPLINTKSTQTKWTYPRNACTQSEPREFSEKEKNEVLSSKSLKDFLNSVSLRFEMALQQNEIMNVFSDDWKALSEDDNTLDGKPNSHLKEFQTFTDVQFSKGKTISCINWHPTIQGLIAVSVTERLSFEDRLNESSKLILTPSMIIFWSFNDPIHPQLLLQSPDDIYCFQFCPSNPNIIAGGCINGQVVLWDITAYEEKLSMKKTGLYHIPTPKTGLEPKAPKGPKIVRFCAVSSIEHGHRNVITDIQWLPDIVELSKTGMPYENKNECCIQLVTCSPDCNVMFWDIRLLKPSTQPPSKRKMIGDNTFENPDAIPNTFKHLDLVWKPFITATIPKNSTIELFGPLKISIQEEHYHSKTLEKLPAQATEESTKEAIDYGNLRFISTKNPKPLDDFSTKYFAGTEDGELVYTDWKMEKDGDTGRFLSAKPSDIYLIHSGFVHTVQRSPFFKDIILSVGGWNFAIWKEGVTIGPILQSFGCQVRYTTAHWSLSRTGVFFIGREDGNLEIWDLLEKTHEPSHTQSVSLMMITSIKPCIVSPKQQFLAVTDHNGTLHILEMPWTLRRPSVHEIFGVQQYFEREVKHLEYFDQRRTIRAAEKKEIDLKVVKPKIEVPAPVSSKDFTEEEILKAYGTYVELEKVILAGLGITENKTEESK